MRIGRTENICQNTITAHHQVCRSSPTPKHGNPQFTKQVAQRTRERQRVHEQGRKPRHQGDHHDHTRTNERKEYSKATPPHHPPNRPTQGINGAYTSNKEWSWKPNSSPALGKQNRKTSCCCFINRLATRQHHGLSLFIMITLNYLVGRGTGVYSALVVLLLFQRLPETPWTLESKMFDVRMECREEVNSKLDITNSNDE